MSANVLLDTNAISDLIIEHPKISARWKSFSETVTTSVVSLGEIRFGVERLPLGKKRSDLEARASTVIALLPIKPITQSIANFYGSLKSDLERRGLNLGDNDLWIASTAIVHGLTLVTRDQLLSRIPGLIVEDWSL